MIIKNDMLREVSSESLKNRFVIGDTFSKDSVHLERYKYRFNGQYKRIPHYTIDKSGLIHQHLDPVEKSDYSSLDVLNQDSIFILLENQNYLERTHIGFIDFIGSKIKDQDNVYRKQWRGKLFWDTYTKEQINALVELLVDLGGIFKIPLAVAPNNTNLPDNYGRKETIYYLSNFDKNSTSVNPSFPFDEFSERLSNIKLLV